MRRRGLAVAIALVAAIAYALLGTAVAHRPPRPLWPIDEAAAPFAGHATHLALIFTASCWWEVLVTLGVAAVVLAATVPAWRARAIFSIVVTVVGWQSSDVLKNLFARARPPYWHLIHEPSYAYSSGHAMFAVLVYGLWSFFVATSALPRAARIALATLLALWACGIVWSRLALGAHWPTDLIGGMLLATTVLALATSVAPVSPRATSRSH